MKKYTLLILIYLFAGFQMAMAQQDNVHNIRAVQEDKIVTITYDLKTRSDVRLLISIDDGAHYTDTMKVTGFINRSIPPGKNRTIRWKAFQDLGYGDYPLIRFKFITQESKPAQPAPVVVQKKDKKTFFTLNGSYDSSGIPMVGFTVGQYSKFGWFVTLMTGLNFEYTGYQVVDHCKKDGYIGDILPFYSPENNSKISAVSGMVGGIMRLNDAIYAKAGVGYGMRSVAWQLWEGDYVTNDGFSAHGVDVGVGLLFDLKPFVITLDGVTTNFHVFEARLGLGMRFSK